MSTHERKRGIVMDRLKALAGIIKKNLKANILKLQIYPGVSNRTKQKLTTSKPCAKTDL